MYRHQQYVTGLRESKSSRERNATKRLRAWLKPELSKHEWIHFALLMAAFSLGLIQAYFEIKEESEFRESQKVLQQQKAERETKEFEQRLLEKVLKMRSLQDRQGIESTEISNLNAKPTEVMSDPD